MNNSQDPAADALRALCEPLLDRAEANLSLFGVIEPEVIAHLTNASRGGFCCVIVIRRIEARLAQLRRISLGLEALRAHGPRLG